MKKVLRKVGVAFAMAALASTMVPATSQAASADLRIWADADRKSAVEQVAREWAKGKNVRVIVVQKEFGAIRDDLKTVNVATAPDVIVGAHDWVGELSANGSVIPLTVPRAVAAKIPAYARDAFSFKNAKGNKVLYGAPVALENIALVVNTQLAKVPTSFDDLVKQALAFQNKAAGNIGLAVSGGNSYDLYPFLSGLCGYVFGKDAKGNLNAKDVGFDSAKLLANLAQVDSWNQSKFLSSTLSGDAAKSAFLAGKAAFRITGPWEKDDLAKSGLKIRIVGFPKNKCDSVPFLGVQGFMVTKFAKEHGVESQARDLVGSYMMSEAAQTMLANANGRAPANIDAAAKVTDRLLKGFASASRGGVPMPNIPEMGSVWGDMGNMWTNSLKGATATPARENFRTAAKNIRAKVG